MRAASVLLGVLLAAVLAGRAAAADTVRGTRYAMTERAHTIAIRVDRGSATLVAQRTVFNPGPASDQALFLIDLPEGAVPQSPENPVKNTSSGFPSL